ncbi:MAG: hypothetical protein KGH63_02375 [Candidatus Micrarchaeota archaeon]|nr:hypothetical protein [Candidatus Micrarchaeota archaeon]
MFENVKPEDMNRYKIIALLVVLAVSTVALIYSGPGVSGGSSTTPADTGANAIDTFNGTASTNATLLSWDPSLVVVGSGLGLDSLVTELKDAGVVTNDVSTPDGRILRLADSADVFNLTQQLTALNLSVYDEAVISVPDVNVVGPGIEKTVAGSTFRYTTVPIFDQGDVFPITFQAQVVNGQLYSLGSIRFDAGAPTQAEVLPLNAALNSTFWRVSVPWESRNANANQLQAYLPGGSFVAYKPRSYVTFSPPLSTDQLDLLSQHMPAYAVSLQPGLMGVNNNMTNRSLIIRDLAAVGLNATFPDSLMDVWAWRYPNETEAQWKSRSFGIFNQTFPGLVADNVTTTYRLELTLPASISDGTYTYIVTNRTLDMNSLYPPQDGYTVKLIFTPVGRRAVQFTQAEYSAPTPYFEQYGSAGGANASSAAGGAGPGIVVTDQSGQNVPMIPANGSGSGANAANQTGAGNGSAASGNGSANGTAPGPQTGTRMINYTGQLPPGAG